ncbi:hypothetical protein FX016_21745 [Cupriavidus gilardii]|nr:hypothetical protein FX016_21745 [Cupriavidus gilardii]
MNAIPHPGLAIMEAMKAEGLTMARLTKGDSALTNRFSRVIHGQANITPQTAAHLAACTGGKYPMEYWIRVQAQYDLARAMEYAAQEGLQ